MSAAFSARMRRTLTTGETDRIRKNPESSSFGIFLSAAEFADLVLNEPACRGGELIHAADARKVTPIDGVCGRDACVFSCENGGDANALRAQGAHLLCRVIYADLPVVVAAEGILPLGRILWLSSGEASVKGAAGAFRRSRADQLARAAQRKAVAVPAGGKIVENVALSVLVGKVLQNAQHGVAAQTAKSSSRARECRTQQDFWRECNPEWRWFPDSAGAKLRRRASDRPQSRGGSLRHCGGRHGRRAAPARAIRACRRASPDGRGTRSGCW